MIHPSKSYLSEQKWSWKPNLRERKKNPTSYWLRIIKSTSSIRGKKVKISANTWFLLSCVGILCGFVLFAMIFGSSETYEVKNTMPVLPIENEVLMRGDEITKEDIGDIVGKTKQLTRESFKHQENSSEQSNNNINCGG